MPKATREPTMTLIQSMNEIPVFASEEEEHRFWQTYELAEELWETLPTIPKEELPQPRTKPVPVRFDEDVLRRVKALAAKRHTGRTSTLRMVVRYLKYQCAPGGRTECNWPRS
ncbi:MAG: hypothetical protein H0X37_13675 [Herpetosiphonaceae bacterium]|nr:hypothetical protein [Herpetosiphonaceae bacterium]